MANPKYLFIEQYAQARLTESNLCEQMCKVVELLNPDNQIFGLVPDGISNLLDALMIDKFGEALMDWVHWWMYECEHGTAHMTFSVEGVEYDPTKLTFKEFLEIVDDRP